MADELESALEINRSRLDAKRYRAFRQLIKDNKLRAQALVWESGGSRTQFDDLVDALFKGAL